jgi:hypothetical protein
VDEANTAAQSSQWGKALALSERAVAAAQASGDTASRNRAATLAGLAACNLKDARRAKRYHAMVTGSAQSLLRQRCLANGVTLD